MDLTSLVDLYDSDGLKIAPVVQRLNQHVFTITDFDAFREEVINRFGEIGYNVDVIWDEVYEFRSGGKSVEVREPTIQITSRVDPEAGFDFDRQVHEVTHDILGVDEPGKITEKGTLKSVDKPVGFSDASKD
jgi:hypothetical protein